MRFFQWISVCFLIFGFAMTAPAQAPGGGAAAARPPFTVTVAGGAQDGGDFPLKNSAAGEAVSPSLSWENPPAGTVTFLIHLHDMDNTHNKTTEDQLHWMVWNIPASETGLPEGVPKGPQLADGAFQTSATGVGTYRAPGFAGNGPKHHYMLELLALDTRIDVPNGNDPFDTRDAIIKAAQGHVLGKALWVGLFRRPPGTPPAGR